MEASSTTTKLPPGVKEEDLYDGETVVALPSGRGAMLAPEALTKPIPAQPAQSVAPEPPVAPEISVSHATPESQYLQAVTLALDVLSARLLGLVALLAAVVFWWMVVYDPSPYRIAAASAFSVLVFGPIMVIYWRAGMAGEGS